MRTAHVVAGVVVTLTAPRVQAQPAAVEAPAAASEPAPPAPAYRQKTLIELTTDQMVNGLEGADQSMSNEQQLLLQELEKARQALDAARNDAQREAQLRAAWNKITAALFKTEQARAEMSRRLQDASERPPAGTLYRSSFFDSARSFHELAARRVADLGRAVEEIRLRLPDPDAVDLASRPELLGDIQRQADGLRTRTEDANAAVKKLIDEQKALAVDFARELQKPMLLTVSGGVSLGSYQAGFLHYYTQYLLAHRDIARRELGRQDLETRTFSVATGASAGSINAFLSALAACRVRDPNPENSLFYRVWIPVGLKQLMNTTSDEEHPAAIFSTKPIEAAVDTIGQDLGAAPSADKPNPWSQDHSCDAALGISATHLRERKLNVAAINIRSQAAKFVLRIQKSGSKPLTITALPPPDGDAAIGQTYSTLVPPSPDESSVKKVTDLIQASARFPVAFPPKALEFLPAVDGRSDRDHGKQSQDFIDGGVFDNTPIGLARQVYRWSLAGHKTGADGNHDSAGHLFVSPGIASWKARPPSAQAVKDRTLFDYYGPFLFGFLDTAMEARLLESLQVDDSILKQLEVPIRKTPLASEYFANFFGFMEKDFRRFDFYVGMVDAWQHLTSGQSLALQHMGGADIVKIDSNLFHCLRELRSHDTERERRAQRPIEPDVFLPEACAEALQHGDAEARQSAKNVLAVSRATRRLRYSTTVYAYTDANRFKRFTELLAQEGFAYREFEHQGAAVTPDTVVPALRDVAQDRLSYLGDQQPYGLTRLAVEVLGPMGANAYLGYRAPARLLYLGAVERGFEVGFAQRALTDRLRLHVAVEAGRAGLERLLHHDHVAFSPAVRGMLVAELPVVVGLVAPELGAGYMTRARVGLDREAAKAGLVYYRHGAVAMAGVVVLQRIYAMVLFDRYVGDGDCRRDNHCSHVAPRYRDQGEAFLDRSWGLAVDVGWRWHFG
ncbi:MAG: patatin-like phospholipase family protein [Deltaproteobacteria bacterium]|nr:patatin-like phospholipase family protein [Deltaproteobacteria bacterium]